MKKISLAFVIILVTALALYLWKREEIPVPSKEVPALPSEQKGASTIIAFGDSLTAGYGLPLTESYPYLLEKSLREKKYSVSVINAGVSGETTRANAERAAFIGSQKGDIVLLGIGGNDALRFLPLDETKKNIIASVETLLQAEKPPRIVLLGMQAPYNSGIEYKRKFDALYGEIAKEYKLTLIPFIVPEVFLDESFMLPDGIHPNKDGYQKIVDTYLVPQIASLLERK